MVENTMEPILAVWDQYKHLDILLSDPAWMLEDGHPMAPQRKCLLDCWLAIKKVIGDNARDNLPATDQAGR